MSPGLRFLTILLCAMFLAGCAVSSTTVLDEEVVTNQKPMSSYKSLVVREFELRRELFTDVPEARMDERDKRYSLIPGQLADQIARYVKSHRNYQIVSRHDIPATAPLILKGRFTRMGRFRISVEALLLDGTSGQEVAYFRQTLWDIIDTTGAVGQLGQEIADFIDRIQYK